MFDTGTVCKEEFRETSRDNAISLDCQYWSSPCHYSARKGEERTVPDTREAINMERVALQKMRALEKK